MDMCARCGFVRNPDDPDCPRCLHLDVRLTEARLSAGRWFWNRAAGIYILILGLLMTVGYTFFFEMPKDHWGHPGSADSQSYGIAIGIVCVCIGASLTHYFRRLTPHVVQRYKNPQTDGQVVEKGLGSHEPLPTPTICLFCGGDLAESDEDCPHCIRADALAYAQSIGINALRFQILGLVLAIVGLLMVGYNLYPDSTVTDQGFGFSTQRQAPYLAAMREAQYNYCLIGFIMAYIGGWILYVHRRR